MNKVFLGKSSLYVILKVTIVVLSILMTPVANAQENKRQLIDSLHETLVFIEDDSLKAMLNLKLFDSYNLYSSDTAKIYLTSASQIADEMSDPFVSANVQARWAKVLVNEGLLDSALTYLHQSLPYFEKGVDYSDPFSVAYLYGQYYELTTVHYMRGNYENALEANLKCIQLQKNSLEKDEEWNDDMAKLYHLRAIILFHSELIDEAKIYLDKGIQLTKSPILVSHISQVQAVIYQQEGKPDSAEIKLLVALKGCEDSGIHHVCFASHSQLGAFYRETEQFEKSKYHYEEGLRFAKLQNSIHAIMNSQQGLGHLLTEMGNYNEASKSYRQLNSLYNKYPDLNLGENFYKVWAEVEDTIGNYKFASELFQKYVLIQDTTVSSESKSIIAEMESKYKLAEKNIEINEAKLTAKENENQRNLLFGGVGFLSLLGLYIWNRSRLNKQIYVQENQLLIQQKNKLETENKLLAMSSMIEGQESERKRIAQDLHDGLGGLLATIKVKFNIIQKELRELESMDVYQRTSNMIDDACTEVRKIAHNMMPDSLTKLGLVEAVRDISEYTSDINIKVINLGTYGMTETQDIMIYRIIQEFINNTRKHAHAAQIIVQFSSDDHHSIVYLEDDGCGFDLNSLTAPRGLGLKSIESRIKYLGGTHELDSTQGVGTTLQMWIPKTL